MLFRRRKDVASRPWRLSAKLLIASSVVTVLGFSAICASVMLDMRRGEEELARQSLENLATGIDADISRNIEIYDLSLRAVAGNMVMPEIRDVGASLRHLILFDHAATAKHFGAIQVFDAAGRLTIDASTLDPRPEDRSDEEYFHIHRDHPDIGLFISRPMLHRGAFAIVLSRRISRRRRTLSGRRRGLDPLQLFSRPVRPAASRSGRHHHRAAPRPHRHHADAVRPRHHRQEFGRAAKMERGEYGERDLCGSRSGRSHSAPVGPA